MFGRLATVRLRSAEDAIAEGRIDEAYEILNAGDLASNRRAAELRAALAERLLHRGQDHLMSRRFSEALADFDRAVSCDKDDAKAAEWKKRAELAMRENKQARHERDTAVALAKERLAAGELAEARAAVGHLPVDDAERRAVEASISQRDAEAVVLVERARKEYKAKDVRSAVQFLRDAAKLNNGAAGLDELQRQVIDRVVGDAVAAFKEGRLDRCGQELAVLDGWSEAHSARSDLDDALRLAREAARALAGDRYARASVLLGRLAQMGFKAGWISDVRKHLDVLDERRRALMEGPLGLLSGAEVPSALSVAGRPPVMAETLARSAQAGRKAPPIVGARAGNGIPKRLMLRIDGAGSFLLLRGDRVSVGRAGPGATADLQLVSDLSERHADIVRAGEDYFVASSGGVELAGHPVEHALLQDGDRVRFGKRVRLTFRRPSQKSAAAALDLGEGVRTAADCRRVILWTGPLILGATRDCHIKLGVALGRAVLIERAGQLLLRRTGQTDEVIPLVIGQQVESGELRLSVHEWSDDSGRVIG